MIAVTYAMPEEVPRGHFPDSVRLIQTGIGKVLAVSQVAKHLRETSIEMIVSVGFCGGLNGTPQGAMVQADRTEQWDLYLNDLDIPLGHGYAMHCPLKLPHVSLESVPSPLKGTLISGDRFVDRTVHVSPHAVAVDMETAALALLARELQIPFVTLREVSDVADGPQEKTHQMFMDYIQQKGPAYSDAVRELAERGPEGIGIPELVS